MLRYVYHGLESFQSVFSRHRSWLLFAAVVLSFLAAPEMIGVTSMCRFWLGDERVYHSLLHFFRSKAYGFDELLDAWQRYVLSQEVAVKLEGRCVLLGDHTHVVKDGGRMPGVVSLRETSETQQLGSAKGSPPPLAFKTVLATLAAHGSSVNGALVTST